MFISGSIKIERWGNFKGSPVKIFTLTNKNGLELRAINFGATLVSLSVPNKKGEKVDIALGYPNLQGYLEDKASLGATVGRYANRIAGASFTLGNQTYSLNANEGVNTLHGGGDEFRKKVWNAGETRRPNAVGVVFQNLSPDGEQGFPGNLETEVIFWLTDKNEFIIHYKAISDKTTVVNFTNHTYWNLAGEGSGTIVGHELQINAHKYTPVDSNMIPTGALAEVEGTPFNFKNFHRVGERVDAPFDQIKFACGYDHNWVIKHAGAGVLTTAALLKEPASGRCMEVLTTEPGLQIYSGNHLDGSIIGKMGIGYGKRSGICLETQHFPDSPNRPNFPSTVLNPGHMFTSTTVHRLF